MTFRPKILVVEDDPQLQHMLETIMRHMGADPRCIVPGQQAISLVETNKFDGAFVDWDARDFDAADLTQRIRRSKSNAKIPIAMLSTRSHQEDVARGFKAGATFFLSKPFGANELERLLNATRGAMLEDRRRYQRVPLSVPTLCEWGQKRRARRIAGRIVNVSSGGLLMKLTPRPEAGTAVSVELRLPGQATGLVLRGMVARAGPGDQVAVRFVYLAKEQQERLENFVSQHPDSSLFPQA
ncbi:MAG: response regulator [Acidobacteriia bacterium]|nr:response regulator [Terriglobia bacterium]